MLTFGATLILVGEVLLLICFAILYVELRRNFTAIKQVHLMINLFMDELLHPQTFNNSSDKDENKS